MRWDNEMRQNAQKRNAANKLTAAIKRQKEENTIRFQKIANENDQLIMDVKNQAANKIKAFVKRNENINGVESMKSLISKRVAAK